MTEKLLENWLTNSNERAYMIPYCQLLLSKGYKLLYISPHGMLEEGKDIIALNPKGKPEAFQLKNGDITLGVWRKIKGEIEELLTLPIQHASVPEKSEYKSWLVTNGEVKDPVRKHVTTLNRNNWGQSKNTKLEYQDKGILLADFLSYYGKFFPDEPQDFKFFLEIYLSDGANMFPIKDYSKFIEPHLGLIGEEKLTSKQLVNKVSSAIILTSYLLTNWVAKNNFFAQLQAWVSLEATIYGAASKHKVNNKTFTDSVHLIEAAIESCLSQLLELVKTKNHLIEGDWRVDNPVYGARATLVLGTLCGYALWRRLQNNPLESETEIVDVCAKFESKMKFYGESFAPYIFSYCWLNELNERVKGTANRLSTILMGLTNPKMYPNELGWPSPYYDLEEATSLAFGIIPRDHTEYFVGQSFALKAIIEFIARRSGRDFLTQEWRRISHTQYSRFIPQEEWQYFVWRSPAGMLDDKFPKQTESWENLYREAFDQNTESVPKAIQNNPAFGLLFLFVYPHRLNSDMVKFLDLLLVPNLKKALE